MLAFYRSNLIAGTLSRTTRETDKMLFKEVYIKRNFKHGTEIHWGSTAAQVMEGNVQAAILMAVLLFCFAFLTVVFCFFARAKWRKLRTNPHQLHTVQVSTIYVPSSHQPPPSYSVAVLMQNPPDYCDVDPPPYPGK